MKDHLLVTLSDRNYVDQAKQLFSSVYFHSAWPGDYMLLACDVPDGDLQWFRKKGILVKECRPLITEDRWYSRLPKEDLAGTSFHPAAITAKTALFHPEFKKWKTVSFLDADIIVRGPLDLLTKVKSFSAVSDGGRTLRGQLRAGIGSDEAADRQVLKQLASDYDLERETFNVGVFSFPSRLIEEDTVQKLNALIEEYLTHTPFIEQLACNLYFYDRWEKLPAIYNYFVYHVTERAGRKLYPQRFHGVVLHFPGLENRPWREDNKFYPEWRENLKRSEEMNTSRVLLLTHKARMTFWFSVRLALMRLAILRADRKLRDFLRIRFHPIYAVIRAPIEAVRRIRAFLDPLRFVLRFIEKASQNRVLSGPFAGMSYVAGSVMSQYHPKLLGTYEKELWQAVETLCRRPFRTLVNVGAGEGYYAVGFAMRVPSSQVVAFELLEEGQILIRKMAELNEVSRRIRVFGSCDRNALGQALSTEGSPLIVMDVEGDEWDLLDPQAVAGLRGAAILVEIHDFARRGMGETIASRFQKTHRLTEIKEEDRVIGDFPIKLPRLVSLLFKKSIVASMSEKRGDRGRWFLLEPTQDPADPVYLKA